MIFPSTIKNLHQSTRSDFIKMREKKKQKHINIIIPPSYANTLIVIELNKSRNEPQEVGMKSSHRAPFGMSKCSWSTYIIPIRAPASLSVGLDFLKPHDLHHDQP